MLSTMQDGHLTVGTLLRHGSEVHASSEIITWTGSGARRETFAKTGEQAAKLANALRALGITGDQRVGTFMWNNAEHMAAYCAIPAMGAVLHTLNIRLFPEQLVFVANHAEDQVILVDGTLVPLLAKQLPHMRTVRHVIVANGDAATLQAPDSIEVHSYDGLLAEQPGTFDWPAVDERSAAAMCYTSGTTGDPKGVAYSHRSIWLHSMQVCMTDGMRVAESDKALAIVPMFHAMSWGLPYAALMIGASLVLPDRFLQPEPIARILAAEKPTFAAGVPTIWQALSQWLDANPQDISHLREVVVGGSAAPPSLIHAFQERYGVPILQVWGMTETSPLGSIARPPKSETGEQERQTRYTQGRFPAGVTARLIGDSGEELPWDDESVGELQVRGPWVAASYYGVSDVDLDKFHDGWLCTGDVGKISPDGFLTLTDRSKDVIKSGGEWISSVELENAVMGHPAVAEAAVIGVPDEKWDERPLVAVVVREGQRVTAAELRDYIADKVAKWQLPEYWTFVDEVPKTSVGKFDKKRLRAMNSQGNLDITHL
ncbi:long-chain fatty acid--CoA ligase [Streptomyces malaysiensis]|uniref:Long-chain fatty acid--CoA ligase n=1 Tax=Streptomyces malaysiensis subsp. samsunensis TaxID=459658 RepID=A0A9X2RWX6_STRMQ|nr:long-chain fatty acid--CoA ligase [Streptomyces samsunensis]MCQ8831269.1 long-chain fatty acid--CoA ligase [Streptomyces samsunensis]